MILLVIFDFIILILLVFFYLRFKKFLSLPWEEIEESLERAQRLVERLKEVKGIEKGVEKVIESPKEEVLYFYQKGLSVKEIAKKTGLTEGEIELILKTHKKRL